MYWDDLNKDNIERAKELYGEYISQNIFTDLEYFDEYLENHVNKCSRCDEYYDNDTMYLTDDYNYLCQCCYDDLYTIPEEDKYEDYLIEQLERSDKE